MSTSANLPSLTRIQVVSNAASSFSVDVPAICPPGNTELITQLSDVAKSRFIKENPEIGMPTGDISVYCEVICSDECSRPPPKTVKELKLRGGFYRIDIITDDKQSMVKKTLLESISQTASLSLLCESLKIEVRLFVYLWR